MHALPLRLEQSLKAYQPSFACFQHLVRLPPTPLLCSAPQATTRCDGSNAVVSWHSVSASTADTLLQLTTAVPNDSFSLNLGGALSQECRGGMVGAAAAAAPVAPTQAAAAIAAGTGHGNRRKDGGVGGGRRQGGSCRTDFKRHQALEAWLVSRGAPPAAGLMTAVHRVTHYCSQP